MDAFIRNFVSKYLKIIKKYSSESLLKLLAALEYTEAILEITAQKIFGEKIKWLIIFLNHLVKCVIRLQLLTVHKFGAQTIPSLFSLKSLLGVNDSTKKGDKLIVSKNPKSTFKLRHSGRVVRSINNAPSNLDSRDWIVPGNDVQKIDSNNNYIEENDSEENFDLTQDKQRYLSEVLYIMRPICHLSALAIFDARSWKQFLVPLFIDTLSLFLMNGTKNLSKNQRKEMRRRAFLLLHYFIRSPLYDKFSSTIITIALSQVEQRISGSQHIIGPLRNYIPQWRAVYNYCWTS